MKSIGLVLVLAAFGAAAQPWPQEPTAALGVPLGANVAQLDLPRCSDPSHPKWGKVVCIFGSTYARGSWVHELRSLPDLPFQYEAFLFEDDGAVSSVALKVAAEDWPRLRSVLIERYGPPMSITTNKTANLAGAALDSEQLDWAGGRANVTAAQRGADLRTSIAVIEDKAAKARIAERERQSIKNSAPGL